MNAAASSPWRGVRQRAEELGISPRSIYRAIRRGELRAAPVNQRGDLLIHDDWILQWLEARAEYVSQVRRVVR
jgi:excisionase family DNA binding protein